MQQFTVPQFIDVEDKIIGPITVRQFIIMLFGFMLIAICYRIFTTTYFVIFGILIFGISGTFAFFRVNGMPFHFFVLNFVQTSSKPRMRIWASRAARIDIFSIPEDDVPVQAPPAPHKKRLSSSRLNELSLIVDTSGAYRGEEKPAEEKPVAVEVRENVKTFNFKI